jgi:hypothetical protein
MGYGQLPPIEWVFEDIVCRFYHGSFKNYRIQEATPKVAQCIIGSI